MRLIGRARGCAWFGIMAAALLVAGAAHAATYYVDVNYDGANGAPLASDPARPYTNLTDAVTAANAADGHVILVADGTYRSTAAGGFEDFGANGLTLTKSTTISGGYVGQVTPGEAAMNWNAADRVVRSSVIELAGASTRAFYLNTGSKRPTIDGFTIQNGLVAGDGGAIVYGGGFGVGGRIYNCLFTNNVAGLTGGAVYINGNNNGNIAEITNCVFVANQAANGGALRISNYSKNYDVIDCEFRDNVTTANAWGSGGGAVHSDQAHVFLRCLFTGNHSAYAGGAVGGYAATLRNCTLAYNSAVNTAAAVGANGYDPGAFTLENCLVYSNSSAGVAVGTYGNQPTELYVRHCTIADNATAGGLGASAGASGKDADFEVRNSIIANNGATGMTTDDLTPTADYNNVSGHTTDYGNGTSAGAHDNSSDPLFADAANGDYTLTKTSPCVDAATNLGITADLVGTPRPTRYGYDMGCYEESALPILAIGRPARSASGAWPLARIDYAGQAGTAYYIAWRAGGDGGLDKSQWSWSAASVTGQVAFGQVSGLAPGTDYTCRVLASNSYDQAFSAARAFTTRAAGEPAERVWTDTLATGLAAEPANWVPVGLPQAAEEVVLSGSNTDSDLVWGADAGTQVTAWTQEADYAGTAVIGTTYAVYNTAFTNFTVSGDVTVLGGALTHTANVNTHNRAPTTRASHCLALTIGGDLVVGLSGLVHGRNRGFAPGAPGTNGGASHGGLGGGGPSEPVYGSFLTPTLPGMGCMTTGGTGNGPGGGAVLLSVAGNTQVDGSIDVNGIYNGGTYCRAAAGGSVWLRTATLTGTGAIRARGMNSGGGSNTGNGGGGRVAVWLTAPGAVFSGFTVTNIDAAAGTGGASAAYGSAGSVYLRDGNGEAVYVVDFVNRYGDLTDDKVHGFTAESLAGVDLVLRNQALLGLTGATETRQVRSLTADASSNVKFANANNKITCDTLVFDGRSYVKGVYTSANLPQLITGAGSIEVLVGAPRGTVILLR